MEKSKIILVTGIITTVVAVALGIQAGTYLIEDAFKHIVTSVRV